MTSFQQRRAEALVHLPHIRSSVQQLADLIDRIKDLRQPDGTDYAGRDDISPGWLLNEVRPGTHSLLKISDPG
jgi:hypothetical protein